MSKNTPYIAYEANSDDNSVNSVERLVSKMIYLYYMLSAMFNSAYSVTHKLLLLR